MYGVANYSTYAPRTMGLAQCSLDMVSMSCIGRPSGVVGFGPAWFDSHRICDGTMVRESTMKRSATAHPGGTYVRTYTRACMQTHVLTSAYTLTSLKTLLPTHLPTPSPHPHTSLPTPTHLHPHPGNTPSWRKKKSHVCAAVIGRPGEYLRALREAGWLGWGWRSRRADGEGVVRRGARGVM